MKYKLLELRFLPNKMMQERVEHVSLKPVGYKVRNVYSGDLFVPKQMRF